jgi:histidine ammonia-lyase
MSNSIIITGSDLTLVDFEKVVIHNHQVKLDKDAYKRVAQNRNALESVVEAGNVIYGVNTGFGPMCNRIIPSENITELQLNLIRSHSSGHGNPLSKEIVKGCMLLRANTLARGFSGVRPVVIETLLEFINQNIYPFIPERGSVGASGDLIHLAHLALTLIGEGLVMDEGKWKPAGAVLQKHGIEPLVPSYKEGLALINGTSMTSSMGCFALMQAKKMVQLSTACVSMSLEVLCGTIEAFKPELHSVKPHWGQKVITQMVNSHLCDSQLIRQNHIVFEKLKKDREKETLLTSQISIQDAYSLRCVPQIIGPVVETINFVENILTKEINSTSDNPVILNGEESVTVCHGGHFHAQYCSMVLDYLSIALAEIGVLAERQINRLTNEKLNGGLPPFLIPEGHGLRSGLMGIQYLATSTVAELQALCTPLSVHSISTNADNQDIVSMGPSSALRALDQVEKVCRVFAVELLTIMQGLDLRDVSKASTKTQKIYKFVRERVPSIVEDRPMFGVIDELIKIMKSVDYLNLIGASPCEDVNSVDDTLKINQNTDEFNVQNVYEYVK